MHYIQDGSTFREKESFYFNYSSFLFKKKEKDKEKVLFTKYKQN